MLFEYTILNENGSESTGSVDALSEDIAITSLQRRGLSVSSIRLVQSGGVLGKNVGFFERVSLKDIVILSRQIATLFEAQVSALTIFTLISSEAENPLLQDALRVIAQDLEGGSSVAKALSKHPKIFSNFYVNMVASGEESGRLEETFSYLADYLDRNYELTSKARNALIYPAFIIVTFIAVMVLMLTFVIPKISVVLLESGAEIPTYTRIILGLSAFLVDFWLLIVILLAFVIGGLFYWTRTEAGKDEFSRMKISIPYVGNLFRKLYLSRLADNMQTMLKSGISMVRALEVTATVIDNRIYEKILNEASESISTGKSVSQALDGYPQIPQIMVQMVRVGEETGKLAQILETLSTFYRREVNNAVDTLVGLIEPVMIVALGLGVGTLLAAVLIPIYSISSSI